MESFKNFLNNSRKSNGDEYLERTIENYAYNVERYKKEFEQFLPANPEKAVVAMNEILKRNPHENLRASFKAYLIYKGVEPDSDLLKTLRIKDRRSSALTSSRKLSSKVLSREELKRLYEAADDDWKLIIGFLYDTACRENEMLSVMVCDVYDLEGESSEELSAKVVINAGKGGKKREVYISRDTHDRLKARIVRQGLSDYDKIFVFKKSDGNPYKRQEKYLIDNIVRLSMKVLGRKITPHHFRHTKLTHLCDEGADGYGISRYAGHSDVKQSQVYLKNSKYAGRNAYIGHSRSITED